MSVSNTLHSNNVFLLMGPTASGKTSLALQLAQQYPIEIINVDSALIYRDMNIGSAKPSIVELSEVRHHLIDIITPLESYSVGSFIQDCKICIDDILSRGKIPLLVGGTMMYYNALINGLSQVPLSNPHIRQSIGDTLNAPYGRDELYQELMRVDPLSVPRINYNDTQRLVRAIEVYKISGLPMSSFLGNNISLLDSYNYTSFAIMPSIRSVLHQKISLRTQNILDSGLIEELTELLIKYPNLSKDHTAIRSIGYSQVYSYLAGEFSYAQLQELISAATRQLAKRQLTWLRSIKNNIIIDDESLDIDNMLEQIINHITISAF